MTFAAGERRWPISMVSGLRIAQRESCSISGGIVAENNRVWRVLRAAFDDLAHVRHKAHIEHAIGFIENQDFDLIEPQHAPLQLIEQPARASPRQYPHPAAAFDPDVPYPVPPNNTTVRRSVKRA